MNLPLAGVPGRHSRACENPGDAALRLGQSHSDSQAGSLKEMNPERPFYLLDDGAQPIPPLFYPLLNKCLALPLLPDWAGYWWENGRAHELITLLDEGKGQGYAAWRVLATLVEWQSVIQGGLQKMIISF